MRNRFTNLRRGLTLAVLFATGSLAAQAQGVGIGTTAPDASAALDIASSTKGALLPRLTSAQRAAISTPATGLLVFQTDAPKGFYYNAGTATTPQWQLLNPTGDNLGNHTATQTLNLGPYALTGTGADLGTTVGVGIRADGGLNIGQNTGGNIFLGYQGGYSNTDGFSNLFSGYQSGYSNTGGYYNTFSGYQSGYNNTGGYNNTFSGNNSGYNNTGGYYNTFSGNNSGYNNTTGYSNTCLGAGSGGSNTTGFANTYLGTSSGGSNGLINATALGYRAFVNANNTIQLGNANTMALNCNVGVTTPSDMRFKYQVQANVPGLAFITRLRPVTYRFDRAKLAAFTETGELPAGFTPDPAAAVQTGFLAQQVEQAAQTVGYRFDGVHAPANARDHYSLIYAQFVVPLVQAVQEQQTQIEALQAQNAILREQAVQTTADHASLLSLQAQLARLLGEGAQARK